MQAIVVRVFAFALPILLGWLGVRALGESFWRAESPVAWVIQALLVAMVISIGVERVTRRLLPLAFVLNQTLVFPDEAPSKFGAALRANNLGRIEKRIEELRSSTSDRSDQQAALDGLSLVAALSKHDRFTRGHTERVRAYADLIAKELGLSLKDRSRLAWGVLLHDIGKLTVPAEVLNKKTPLADAEWELLKQHPSASAEFLSPMASWLGEWGRAAGEHHERWDGNGYPNGLTGKEISLAGRITAVADAYDVITSTRSYKAPMSAEAARQELVRCASTQFDPVVVRAMLRVSVGRQRNFGIWSWLTEVPSIARLFASVGSTSAGTAVAVAASVAAVAAPLIDVVQDSPVPAELAFVEADSTEPDDAASPAIVDLREPTPVEDTVIPPTSTTSTTLASTTTTSTVSKTDPTSPTPTTAVTEPPPTTAAATDPPPTTAATTNPPSTTATPPSTTATTNPPSTTATTNPPPTTTLPPGDPITLFLKNPGSAMTTNSRPVLPLELSAPGGASVGNWDADRNSEPGITIKKDGAGYGQTDPTKIQLWEYTFSAETILSGTTELELYIAADTFETSETLGVAAQLSICDPSCSAIASTTWSSSATSDWKRAILGFGTIGQTFGAGDVLQLRVIATDSLATDDMMFAYDSIPQSSALRVG